MHKFVPKIVITGGPCGGKSSAMPFLHERLSEGGFYPILVPEAPTILMNNGHLPHGGNDKLREFQERVIDLILIQEEEAHQHAVLRGHLRPIIICDRGIIDTRAYTDEEMFHDIITSRRLELADVLGRYYAVFHMQTTAIDAEAHYTKENNTVRLENLEEARGADARTLHAWSTHPRLTVIENKGKSFDQKLDTLWRHVVHALENE